jgi:hypothetical protein
MPAAALVATLAQETIDAISSVWTGFIARSEPDTSGPDT